MRTSNKILLGIFIGPLIILTLIHLTMYAKYKSGSYTAMKTVVEDRFTRTALKNINNIAVYGVENCRIIPSDSLKLEIEKDKNGHLHYSISGDTLIIHGDTVVNKTNGSSDVERSYQDVNLYLPSSATITADNTELVLQGSKDSTKAKSYNFSMTNSASLKVHEDGEKPVYFKGLVIHTANSNIELTAYTSVFDLQLTMLASAFTDNGASIEKLVVDADKASDISLKGDNLKKLNAAH